MRTEIELPEELSIEFDNIIKGHYANRSEAIRDSMRLLMDRLKESKGLGRIMTDVRYAIRGEERKTKSGVFVCPSCGNKHWTVSLEEDKSAKCEKCGEVMAKEEKDLDGLLVEKEVDAYVCPKCGTIVEDTPLNYTFQGTETIDGQMSVMCPKCHNFVNGLPLLHHGASFGDFEPEMSDTDYFFIYHKPCKDEGEGGLSDVYACLIDNTGRIILNVQCQNCKAVEAIKTAPFRRQGIEHIFISPNLRKRIGKHSWDDR